MFLMKANEHIHILGITGHAMRGVALALKERGYVVTGTDPNAYSPGTDWLDAQGIRWWREPSISHLEGVGVVVLGGGVAIDQLELIEAQKLGIKITSYPELVGELIKDSKRLVVTGTHGKTTTTSMLAWILECAGRQPDFLIGIKPNNFDSSVRLRGSKVTVLEGDEYRSSSLDMQSKFIYYKPNVVIITSIEHDHPDLFPDLQSVERRFKDLVEALPRSGRLYVCADNQAVVEVAANSAAPLSTYGAAGEWQAQDISYLPDGIVYKLVRHNEALGMIHLPLYGLHNVLNSLAAAAVALNENVSFDELKLALLTFTGASRRFERVSAVGANVTVIDDYAHHPTEVAATVAAAKKHFDGRVIAIFRPHTYSRTQALLGEFQDAFRQTDQAYIVPIEGARERGESTVSGADIAAGAGEKVIYEPERAKLINEVLGFVKTGDVVLCMSVNGYDGFAQELALLLQGV